MSIGDRPIRTYWVHLLMLGVLAIAALWFQWLALLVGVWLIGDAYVAWRQ